MGVKDAWIVPFKDAKRVEIKDVLEGVTATNPPGISLRTSRFNPRRNKLLNISDSRHFLSCRCQERAIIDCQV